MEYIYCKDNEEYEHTIRTLESMGYENKLSSLGLPLPCAETINNGGITIFVSDKSKIISGEWAHTFFPCGYKPSKLMKGTEVREIGAWKDLKNRPSNETKHRAKTDLEPLDDTEELKVDREKLRKFAKDTEGKAKITLAPMQILKDVAEVREYGVKKYGSVDSWKEVPIEDYRDALFRHLLEYIKDPNSVDKESGIKHYKHIACNLAFICEMENMEDDTRSI